MSLNSKLNKKSSSGDGQSKVFGKRFHLVELILALKKMVFCNKGGNGMTTIIQTTDSTRS